jgi:lipoyl(octanoyl) transferase
VPNALAGVAASQPAHRPVLRHLGRVDYGSTLEAMRQFTARRGADSPDELWILEHPAVFTLGQASRPGHLLDAHGISVIQTERGGQITYHGPGQLIVYTLIDLKRAGITIRNFVTRLEAAIVDTLAAYTIVGQRRAGAPGVYVGGAQGLEKIAALGLKVTHGCCFHGISLNVAMDLEPFSWIDPCGFPGLRCTDMRHLGSSAEPPEVAERLAAALLDQLAEKEA